VFGGEPRITLVACVGIGIGICRGSGGGGSVCVRFGADVFNRSYARTKKAALELGIAAAGRKLFGGFDFCYLFASLYFSGQLAFVTRHLAASDAVLGLEPRQGVVPRIIRIVIG